VEWLEFLNSLEKPLSAERLRALDHAFSLSKSGNSEILFAWLMHVVRSSWEPGYPALESFLTRQGRRKFLKPLYEAMMANTATQDLARRIYAKARPGYHPISTATVDKIVK
jgi:leukotriene-A4 hydrolase